MGLRPGGTGAEHQPLPQDLRREVAKVAQFLGRELTEVALDAIAHHTSFEAMRDNPSTNYSSVPSHLMDHGISPFMRKGKQPQWVPRLPGPSGPTQSLLTPPGITGDWKNHFTVAQSAHFDQYYAQKMAGTDLRFRTHI